ncbi:MAG: LON peptidase substrate-binding domain-containing protein [Nitrospinota bacterium]|mgnify:CR=1 FL=1
MPLFPLQVVLLPGEILPLHIFEERYKLMIGECLEGDRPFGVVLVEAGGIRKTGCTARITRLVEKFPDGRMNILTLGEERFEILRLFENRPYLTGETQPVEDRAAGPPPPELARRVWEGLEPKEREALPPEAESLTDPARLSFLAAIILRPPLPLKQALIESLSPQERLEMLAGYLGRREEKERISAQRRRDAGRNGKPS